MLAYFKPESIWAQKEDKLANQSHSSISKDITFLKKRVSQLEKATKLKHSAYKPIDKHFKSHDWATEGTSSSSQDDSDWENSEYDLYKLVPAMHRQNSKDCSDLSTSKKHRQFEALAISKWDSDNHPNLYDFLRYEYMYPMLNCKIFSLWDIAYWVNSCFSFETAEKVTKLVRKLMKIKVQEQIMLNSRQLTSHGLTVGEQKSILTVVDIRCTLFQKIANSIQERSIVYSVPLWQRNKGIQLQDHFTYILELVMVKDGSYHKFNFKQPNYKQKLEAMQLLIQQLDDTGYQDVSSIIYVDRDFIFWSRGGSKEAKNSLKIESLQRIIYNSFSKAMAIREREKEPASSIESVSIESTPIEIIQSPTENAVAKQTNLSVNKLEFKDSSELGKLELCKTSREKTIRTRQTSNFEYESDISEYLNSNIDTSFEFCAAEYSNPQVSSDEYDLYPSPTAAQVVNFAQETMLSEEKDQPTQTSYPSEVKSSIQAEPKPEFNEYNIENFINLAMFDEKGILKEEYCLAAPSEMYIKKYEEQIQLETRLPSVSDIVEENKTSTGTTKFIERCLQATQERIKDQTEAVNLVQSISSTEPALNYPFEANPSKLLALDGTKTTRRKTRTSKFR